ncbi:MAG: type II secretion system protein N [Betaproteobacteria bacterium]
MKGIGVVVACALLLLGAVLVTMPAALVDGRLAAMTAGKLRIADATGTLWRGQGALTDATNSWQLPLTWNVDAVSMLRGEIAVTLAPVGNAVQPTGNVSLRLASITLTNLRATIPAQALAAWLPIRDAPALGGDITLDANEFRWEGNSGQGALNLHWQRARLASSAGTADLGTIDIAATTQERRLVARVSNTGGDVRLVGTMGLTSTGNDGDLTMAPVAGTPPALTRALAALGKPDANGAVRLTWRNTVR